ncbi:MAG: TraX family protein [Eubacteriales bacterium]|nr:TraX family protein [Eubacteriales bacterium]
MNDTVRQIKYSGFFSADGLKWIAMLAMLLDHAYFILPNMGMWMTCVGRIAFPIFAFQAAEGIRKTHDIKKYIKRLTVFALISEIPFDLFANGMMVYPYHQNVIFTLLIAVVTIHLIKKVSAGRRHRWTVILIGFCGPLLAEAMFTDYGWKGVATVMAFYLCAPESGKIAEKYKKPVLLALMIMLHVWLAYGEILEFTVFRHLVSFPLQGFALFALIPVFLYNGERGKYGRTMQKITYVFYPVHMMILYIIQQLYSAGV